MPSGLLKTYLKKKKSYALVSILICIFELQFWLIIFRLRSERAAARMNANTLQRYTRSAAQRRYGRGRRVGFGGSGTDEIHFNCAAYSNQSTIPEKRRVDVSKCISKSARRLRKTNRQLSVLVIKWRRHRRGRCGRPTSSYDHTPRVIAKCWTFRGSEQERTKNCTKPFYDEYAW